MRRLFLFSLCVLPMCFLFAQDKECSTKKNRNYPKEIFPNNKIIDNQKIVIPVVFHVIYKNETENISREMILNNLEVLYKDFMNLNLDISEVPDDFKNLIGSPNIEFKLAHKLANGESTTGIIRKKAKRKIYKVKRRDVFYESPIIDSKSYLNIYICDIKNSNAYVPSGVNSFEDGIVIDYKRFLKTTRTLTHEAGHWLNLRHIFKGGCRDKDYVDDTPAQKKGSLKKCHTYPNVECGTESSLIMNFMDYSKCRVFFTKGQVERMNNYISKYKIFKNGI